MFIYKFIINNNIFKKRFKKDYFVSVRGTILIILLNYYLLKYYFKIKKFKFQLLILNYLKWLFK
jgi:hypothetical protein